MIRRDRGCVRAAFRSARRDGSPVGADTRVAQVTPAEHAEFCAQLAPAFAAVPGLVSLTWLTNDTTRQRPTRNRAIPRRQDNA